MIKYPKDYDPITEYWSDIKSGKEIVGKKIYTTYKKLAKDIKSKDIFYFSHSRSNHIIEFVENFCKHSKGKMAGKPVILELWEKAMLSTIFGFIDIEGNRKYREALLIVAKKNGKSLIASCVGLYLQIGDNEGGSEVYAVATMKEQAKIVWQEAKRMVNKSPFLKKRIKTLVGEMVSDFNDGIFKPLASDVNTLDGKNVHGGIMDEIHQWKNGVALYDIISDGVTAREQPLILITSTAGTIREDLYDDKYDEAEAIINGYENEDGIKDDRFIAFIYELDKREEWIDPNCWKKANPGLGTIKNLATLEHKVQKAKENSKNVKNLVCKEFNIRETTGEAWLPFETILNKEMYDLQENSPKYAIGGVDLSETTDLTAARVLFQFPNEEKIYSISMYWLPEDLLEKRIREDKVPYDVWRDMGLLRTCRGNTIRQKDITNWFVELKKEHNIYLWKCGYDGWSAKYWVEEMEEQFGENVMEEVRAGAKTLSNPMKKIERLLEAKNLMYNDNKIDKWCLSNTAIDVDKNNEIRPIKTRSAKKRIDGTMSLLCSYVILDRYREEYLYISKRR
jgi:phage terminase large subunit-like protein